MTKSAKTSERILLDKLYAFLLGRNFVQGMPDMLRDMVKRYKQPPLTMHYRVGMQMTITEYEYFFGLLTELHEYMMATATPVQVDNESVQESFTTADVLEAFQHKAQKRQTERKALTEAINDGMKSLIEQQKEDFRKAFTPGESDEPV